MPLSSPWSGSPPPPSPGGPGTGPPPLAGTAGTGTTQQGPQYLADNRVEYLIDGVTVFEAVATQLQDVATHAHGSGYVHMRFWECDPETTLEPGVKFKDRIAQVAADNDEVRLILWQPGVIERAAGLNDVYETNVRCKQVLEAIDPVHIKVELVEHSAVQGALHTKTMTFCDGDSVVSIVGGLNMADAYRDAPPHNTWSHWHDAAVEIRGAAVSAVENDFRTHWPAAGGALHPALAPLPSGPMKVKIATTQPGNAIYSELEARILAAQNYVYIENFAVHDDHLVNAIEYRMLTAAVQHKTFTPIIVVAFPGGSVYDWVHYVTYVVLSVASSTAIEVLDGGTKQYLARATDGTRRWTCINAFGGNWYEDTEFQWDTGSVKIKDIIRIVHDTPLYRVRVCTNAQPARFDEVYIHAKVALFDDAYAEIGSANFNPRSMALDNELSAFVTADGDGAVLNLRNKLWGEHDPAAGGGLPPQNWKAMARQNADTLAAGGAFVVGSDYVFPIEIGEYSKEPPSSRSIRGFTNAKDW